MNVRLQAPSPLEKKRTYNPGENDGTSYTFNSFFFPLLRPPDDKNVAYRRPPLTAYEVFRELVSQRLGQVG